ncbi:MAG: YebC/PmpR family DNA-binding transcriptional regulator [Calditrichia bacterium]
MAGHSKWANIKFRKQAQDAKRGKIFTKLIKEITVSARTGGGDPESNPRLRTAIQKAKQNNMPMKNIENAIKKGTGEIPGVVYEEITYEGYGPGGVAVMVECMTDNKNRTVGEIRHLFSKYGGNLGESGSVSYLFEKKGIIRILKEKYDEEELMMLAIDAGAEDVETEDEFYIVYTTFENLNNVKKVLEENNIDIESAEVEQIPSTTIQLDEDGAKKMMKLMNFLEDHDDVQNVWANFDIDDEILNSLDA